MIDILVILAYFVGIVWVGLKLGRKEDNLKDFVLAGRSVPWWAVLGSIVAAETSAGTFVGTPVEGYTLRNYGFLQLVIGAVLGRVIVSHVFLNAYFRYGVYSIYEFLDIRFGTRTRNLGSAVFLLTRTLATGTRLYIAAIIPVLAWKTLYGAPAGASGEVLLYVGAITAVTILTSIYTAIGGIKAVIWTDIIQATMMMGSGILAVLFLYRGIPGGWETISQQLNGFKDVTLFRAEVSSFRQLLETDYTIWSAVIGYTFLTMATHGTDQDMVQRMLTAPDVKQSRRSVILSGFLELPIFGTFLTVGILLYVFYQSHAGLAAPEKSNEIFGHFILTQMPSGLRGLMIAGVLATAMGSLSSALNALAASYVRDFHLPYVNPRATDAESIRAARWITVVFAVALIAVAALTSYLVILFPKSRIIPIALGIIGYTYGSLLGVFLLGLFTERRGSDRGNLLAMAAGFVTVAFLTGLPNDLARMVGGTMYEQPAWLPSLAFPWRILTGSLVTFAVGACFSNTKIRERTAIADQGA